MIRKNQSRLTPVTAKDFGQSTLNEVIGCTGYKGPSKSVEDMETAICRRLQCPDTERPPLFIPTRFSAILRG